jgi:linoleoyl-CoA desaturase
MILLPVLVLPFTTGQILLAFFITHFIMGFITTLVFQTTHVVESTAFPASSDEYEHFVYHIFATTADYATRSRLANWFLGGLHQHVIHHLCPNVCHTHYPRLTGIVRETALEFDIPYRENITMFDALVKHFRLLKHLGNHV